MKPKHHFNIQYEFISPSHTFYKQFIATILLITFRNKLLLLDLDLL